MRKLAPPSFSRGYRYISLLALAVLLSISAALLSFKGHASAPQGRFTATPDGVYDSVTNLSWQQVADSTARNWANAGIYCQAKGSNWRLPTISELESLVDTSASSAPTIDSIFSGPSNTYWSSTPDAMIAGYAWDVGFEVGGSYSEDKGYITFHYVRCVH